MRRLKKASIAALCAVMCLSGCRLRTKQDKVKSRISDGKSIVYSINGRDVTADDFYEEMKQSDSFSAVYCALIDTAVANKAVKTTDSITAKADDVVSSMRDSYKAVSSDPDGELKKIAVQNGYEDINSMEVTEEKKKHIAAQYAKAHFDELSIKAISYVLLTDADEVLKGEVDNALASSLPFETVARQFSEDTATVDTDGYLGVIDKNAGSMFDQSFFDTAMSLSEGQTSDWVHSDALGWFKIYCDAATPETMESNEKIKDPYYSLVSNYDSSIIGPAMWEKAQEYKIDFHGNDAIEELYKSHCSVSDASSTAEPSAPATNAADQGGDAQ